MAKIDLPSSDAVILGKYQRYSFLYTKADKTSAENTEMASLQTDLMNYLITANDWNTLQQQVTDGFNGVTSTVNTAITNHKAETDPHPQYATDSDLTAKAPLASPGLTGTPTAPTAAQTTNNTQIATTAFVKTAVGTKNISSTNLNSLSDTGWYDGSNMTNTPTDIGIGWAYVEVIKHTSWSSTNQFVLQKVYDFNSNRSWQRRSTGGSGNWTAWVEITQRFANIGTGTLIASSASGGYGGLVPYYGKYRVIADLQNTNNNAVSPYLGGDFMNSAVIDIGANSPMATYTFDMLHAVSAGSYVRFNQYGSGGLTYGTVRIYANLTDVPNFESYSGNL